jgi:predicted PurR-regulated permease PerM
MNEDAAHVLAARAEVAALVLTAAALLLVLGLHLLPALFAGLLVHQLVHLLAPRMFGLSHQPRRARIVVVALLTALVLALIALLISGAIAFFRSDGGSLALLLKKMAEILDGTRATLPGWVQDWLPADGGELKDAVVEWLREHAAELKAAGHDAGRVLAYLLIGIVVGALVALREVVAEGRSGVLGRAIARCAALVADAFRRVVFAQVRIAALNALLTAIYLAVALPAFGIHLPLVKTMIAFTLVAGLLPIIGNLVSNTVIVAVSLSHSPSVALSSLVFLVIIHKAEYFLNARIVGSQIKCAAWELLVAMLVMEAAFGLPGVIAAPVFYAYAKAELAARGLI